MFEQTFKNIDDLLRKDDAVSTELDYIEQTSWVLFLRYLDNLELEKQDEAELKGLDYSFILKEEFRWGSWAVIRKPDGSIDYHNERIGKDLIEFVNLELFTYLANFKGTAENPKITEIRRNRLFFGPMTINSR